MQSEEAQGRHAKPRRSRSGSIAGVDRVAFVVFRTQTSGADSRHDGEKLLEGHLKVEKPALAEDPAIIVEDLVGNHEWQARQAGDDRETSRTLEIWQISVIWSQIPVHHNTALSQGDNIAIDAANHRHRRS